MLHQSDGKCSYCRKVINRYPGFNDHLQDWFYRLQLEVPQIHVSCAGRNRMDQEAALARGASRAEFGKSAHNYNQALDLFFIIDGHAVWDHKTAKHLFETFVQPRLEPWIEWAANWKGFPELAHVQHIQWKYFRDNDFIKLVSE